MNEDWMDMGTCKRLHIDSRIFFPEQGCQPDIIAFAKRVCSICPVQYECLEHSIEHSIPDGIWGGKTRRQRKELRRVRIMLTNPTLDKSA